MQRRHGDYFAQFAEQAELELLDGKQRHWFERLRFEYDNLRTALAFTLADGESELGFRIAGALRAFWNYGGHVSEGLRWIERLLDNAKGAPPELRAKALNTAGLLSFSQGNFEHGKMFNKEALALYQGLGDQDNITWRCFS